MSNDKPTGHLTIRTQAMPADTNPDGDIFGGWLLSQMDIAGGVFTKKIAKARTVTVAVDGMNFHLPVYVGDVLCCYCNVIKEGRTSISVKVEAWCIRAYEENRVKVTEGIFTYVAIDENARPKVFKE